MAMNERRLSHVHKPLATQLHSGVLRVTIGSAVLQPNISSSDDTFEYCVLVAVCKNATGNVGRLQGCSLPAGASSKGHGIVDVTWNQVIRVPCLQSAESENSKGSDHARHLLAGQPNRTNVVLFSVIRRHKLSGREQEVARGISKTLTVLHQMINDENQTQQQVIQLTNRRGVGRKGELKVEFQFEKNMQHVMNIDTPVGVQTILRSSPAAIRLGFVRLYEVQGFEHSQVTLRVSRKLSQQREQRTSSTQQNTCNSFTEQLSQVDVQNGEATWYETLDFIHSASDARLLAASSQVENDVTVQIVDAIGGDIIATCNINLDNYISSPCTLHTMNVPLECDSVDEPHVGKLQFTFNLVKLKPETFRSNEIDGKCLRAVGVQGISSDYAKSNSLVATFHVHRIVRRSTLRDGTNHICKSHAVVSVPSALSPVGDQRYVMALPNLSELVAMDRTIGGTLVQVSLWETQGKGKLIGQCVLSAKQVIVAALTPSTGVRVPFNDGSHLLLALESLSSSTLNVQSENQDTAVGLPSVGRVPSATYETNTYTQINPCWKVRISPISFTANNSLFHRSTVNSQNTCLSSVCLEASIKLNSWVALTSAASLSGNFENSQNSFTFEWNQRDKGVRSMERDTCTTGKRRKKSSSTKRSRFNQTVNSNQTKRKNEKFQSGFKNTVSTSLEWSPQQLQLPKLVVQLLDDTGNSSAIAVPIDLSPFLLNGANETVLCLPTTQPSSNNSAGLLKLRIAVTPKLAAHVQPRKRNDTKSKLVNNLISKEVHGTKQLNGSLHIHVVRARNINWPPALRRTQAWGESQVVTRANQDSQNSVIVKLGVYGISSDVNEENVGFTAVSSVKVLQDDRNMVCDENFIVPVNTSHQLDFKNNQDIATPLLHLNVEQSGGSSLGKSLTTQIPFPVEQLQQGKVIENWFPLSCTPSQKRHGEILVSVQYIPNNISQHESIPSTNTLFNAEAIGGDEALPGFSTLPVPDAIAQRDCVKCTIHILQARIKPRSDWQGDCDPVVQVVQQPRDFNNQQPCFKLCESFPGLARTRHKAFNSSSGKHNTKSKIYIWDQHVDVSVPLTSGSEVDVQVVNSNTFPDDKQSHVLGTCSLDVARILRGGDNALSDPHEAVWYDLKGVDGYTPVGQVQLKISSTDGVSRYTPGGTSNSLNMHTTSIQGISQSGDESGSLFLTLSCSSKLVWEMILNAQEPGMLTRLRIAQSSNSNNNGETVCVTKWFDLETMLDTHHRNATFSDESLMYHKGWPVASRVGPQRDWWFRHMVLDLKIPDGVMRNGDQLIFNDLVLVLETKDDSTQNKSQVRATLPVDTLLKQTIQKPGTVFHRQLGLVANSKNDGESVVVKLDTHIMRLNHTLGQFRLKIHDLSGKLDDTSMLLSHQRLFCKIMLVSYASCQMRTTQPVELRLETESGFPGNQGSLVEWNSEVYFDPVFADELGPSFLVLQVWIDDPTCRNNLLGEMSISAHELASTPNKAFDFTYTLKSPAGDSKANHGSSLALRVVSEFKTRSEASQSSSVERNKALGVRQLLGLKEAKLLFANIDSDDSGSIDAKELMAALQPGTSSFQSLSSLLGDQVVAKLELVAQKLQSRSPTAQHFPSTNSLSWNEFLNVLQGAVLGRRDASEFKIVQPGTVQKLPLPAFGSVSFAKRHHKATRNRKYQVATVQQSELRGCTSNDFQVAYEGDQALPGESTQSSNESNRYEMESSTIDRHVKQYFDTQLVTCEHDLTELKLEHQDTLQKLEQECAVAKQLRQTLGTTVHTLMTLQKDKYLREARRRWQIAKRMAEKQSNDQASENRKRQYALQNSRAVKIQTIFRGKQKRKEYDSLVATRSAAATKIQCTVRQRQVTTMVNQYRKIAIQAAIQIQTLWRSSVQCRQFRKRRVAANVLQRSWRSACARHVCAEQRAERNSAIIIQRTVRRILAMQVVDERKADQRTRAAAASVIQLAFRGQIESRSNRTENDIADAEARRREIREASQSISKPWEVVESSRSLQEQKARQRAALSIQNLFRFRCAKSETQNMQVLLDNKVAAATRLQSIFRTCLARKKWQFFASRSRGESKELPQTKLPEHYDIKSLLFVEPPNQMLTPSSREQYSHSMRMLLNSDNGGVAGMLHQLSQQVEELAPRYKYAVARDMSGVSHQLQARLERLEKMHGLITTELDQDVQSKFMRGTSS